MSDSSSDSDSDNDWIIPIICAVVRHAQGFLYKEPVFEPEEIKLNYKKLAILRLHPRRFFN